MSGHSKWANIKHRKGKTDALRGKLFAKLSREIIMAVRQGGGPDPSGNSRLRLAIDKARSENMPSDNIQRAIARGSGEQGGGRLEEVICEGYGPGGAAILVEAVTDNRNRTLPELRVLFQRHGGSLGEPGCVAWMFTEKGVIRVSHVSNEEKLTDLAIELGAEDIVPQEDGFEITTLPHDFEAVLKGLREAPFPIVSQEVAKIAKTSVPIEGEAAKKILDLMSALEEQEDVQNVYANFEVSDEHFVNQ